MTKVELFELIRFGHKVEGLSIRALARKHQVHRRTVRDAISNAFPPPRKASPRVSPKMGPFLAIIRRWLEEDRTAPRKQRHTARRIWKRLVDEHQCAAAESTVRGVVAKLRRELGTKLTEAFVPLAHAPGEEAEVDFYEAAVLLPEGPTVLYHFCMRACHSGREFHVAFRRLNQQSFLEGHALAFQWFGGVFARIRYDNLTPAVRKVLQGRRREETERFTLLRSHYLFEAVFCLPGVTGAHEKGGVESAGGRFRRNHLVPVPTAASLDEYNRRLRDFLAQDDLRCVEGRRQRVLDDWKSEVPLLRPLPAEPFDTARVSLQRVDHLGRVQVDRHRYSVPITLHGLSVEIRLGAREVRILHGGKLVARHDRSFVGGGETLVLDHYLELLRLRPGAFSSSRPLQQARARQEWPESFDRLHEAFVGRHGLQAGTRQMVEVLMLARQADSQHLVAAVERALELKALEAAAIRHLLIHQTDPGRIPVPLGPLGELERIQVAVPSLDVFADLAGQEVA